MWKKPASGWKRVFKRGGKNSWESLKTSVFRAESPFTFMPYSARIWYLSLFQNRLFCHKKDGVYEAFNQI
jgi:hypothetical protein